MPKKNVNGVDFNFEILGKNNKTLPPVVFIGGYTWNIDGWREIANIISDTRMVLIYDNQGVGLTKDDGAELSIASMAKNIHALIQSLEMPTPVSVVAFAMGTSIALELGRQFSDDVERLILLSPVVKWSEAAIDRIDKLLNLRDEGEKEKMASAIYHLCLGRRYKKQCKRSEFCEAILSAPEVQTLQDQKRQALALKNFDASGWIEELRGLPVVVLSPEEDLFGLPSDGVELAFAVKGGFISLPCGHCATIEMSDELAALIQEKLCTPCEELVQSRSPFLPAKL